eukprot:gene13139-17651_t
MRHRYVKLARRAGARCVISPLAYNTIRNLIVRVTRRLARDAIGIALLRGSDSVHCCDVTMAARTHRIVVY